MLRKIAMMIGTALILLAAGCAQFSLPSTASGTSAADLRARLGAPNDERAIGGAKVWDYVFGPMGYTTWRVSFDGSDRVANVEQILTEARIVSANSGKLTRQDVSNLLGRPMEVNRYAGGASEVWTYRFMDVQERKFGDIYIDGASGVVKQTSTYPDPEYYGSVDK